MAPPHPPHAYTMHVHTDKQAQCCPSRDHSPDCLCVCGGGSGCRWHRDSSVFLGSLLGGKLLVKYSSIFYFNQPTTCSTFPKCPPLPMQCVSCCAQLTSLSRKPSRFAPQWPFVSSVPPSAHIAAALAQGIEHSVGKGPWDTR